MLFFNFSSFQEFRARKNSAEFMAIIEATKKSLKTYKRAESKTKRAEKSTLAKEATNILFANPKEAVSAIRKALEANPEQYKRLQLDPKAVTMAYVIVINGVVCTIKGKSLDNSKWQIKPCNNITSLITSLEQKRDLVAMAQKAIDKGDIPPCNPRAYISNLITDFAEKTKEGK